MLSDPAREFLYFLRNLERQYKNETRRKKRINKNCEMIRRSEMRIIRDNGRSNINWSEYV